MWVDDSMTTVDKVNVFFQKADELTVFFTRIAHIGYILHRANLRVCSTGGRMVALLSLSCTDALRTGAALGQ